MDGISRTRLGPMDEGLRLSPTKKTLTYLAEQKAITPALRRSKTWLKAAEPERIQKVLWSFDDDWRASPGNRLGTSAIRDEGEAGTALT
jgi:hypothetical protein